MVKHKLKILLIEDNPPDLRIVDIYLKEAFLDNYSLTIAICLSDALAFKDTFDVIISDMSLPDSHGMETFTAVLKANPTIPIIVLTGYGDEAFGTDAVQQGAADFLNKNKLDSDILKRSIVYSIERNKLQNKLNQAAEELEKRIIERTTELVEAKVFAEQAKSIAEEEKNKALFAVQIAETTVKSKQQFLANMSHEIRTPMAGIVGFTKVLLKSDLSTRDKEYLTAIKTSGDALILLINDILDLAKVNAGKISFEQTPFKIGAAISAMLFLFETKAQEKGIKLVKKYDNKIPEVLIGDSARLHQILLNLLSNSLKFTKEGKITVSVHLLNEDAEKVTIAFSVTDTGIGISEKALTTIFESFEQASTSTARLFGGTGLGLAIVKELVEKQGGSITVKSKIDEGSTFTFILSFQKTTAMPGLETPIVELDPEIKGIKVLAVEDNALNQLLIRTILDDFGFERDFADDGKKAIEKLSQRDSHGANINKYDIILMDLQMPVMSGFEATEYIRNTMNSKIPIIALTADVTSTDVKKCKAVGMNDCVAKPIDEHLLYSKIVGLVKKS